LDVEKVNLNGFGILKDMNEFTRKEREEMWRERVK
jgi:hypothetical protein